MIDFWTNMWNFVWVFFVGFAFVVYLVAIVTVLGDLFRDRGLNGWWKAVWIVFLIFVPFLTVLVYVIARGGPMVDRLESREHTGAHAVGPYEAPPGAAYEGTRTGTHAAPHAMDSPASEIKRAKELVDAGVISPGEFDLLKNRALESAR